MPKPGYFSDFQTRWLRGPMVQLVRPLVYEDESLRVFVPEGFVCDGSSVPHPWGYVLLPRASTWKRLARPGAVHDYLCRIDSVLYEKTTDGVWAVRSVRSKREADDVYARAIIRGEKLPRLTARLAKAAFSLAGDRYFRRLRIDASSDEWEAAQR